MKFVESSIENIINIRKNVYFSDSQPNERFSDYGECSHFWKMVYVKNGSLTKIGKGCVSKISADEVLFYAPNKYYEDRVSASDDAKAYYFSFVCDSKAMNLFSGFHEKLSEASLKIMDKLIEEGKQTFVTMKQNGKISLTQSPNMKLGGPQMYKILMESLLINILREQEQLSGVSDVLSSKVSFYEDVCSKVSDYLIDNIYANVSIDDLSRKFNYSSTFLCTKFKECKGISIMQHYTILKINEACNLIKTGKYSVFEISEILNYSHPYSFSRAFKRVVGVSPKHYKESLVNLCD